MKSCLLFNILASIALACLFTGCVAPRITAPRAGELLAAKVEIEKIPIRSFVIKSNDRPVETEHDMRLLAGTSRLILYPKQAREFIEQDIRDNVSKTFTIEPASDVVLTLTLVQAYNYFTMVSSGANLIPFVGVVTSAADSMREIPYAFIVEVEADARKSASETASTNVFVKSVETSSSAWQTKQTQDDRYRKQLTDVRTELFERLDRGLLPMWKDRQFVGKGAANAKSDTASLAYELSRLDASLADGKITRDEHVAMTKGATERFSANQYGRLPTAEAPTAPAPVVQPAKTTP